MEKSKASIIWKTSDRKTKRSEIWDSEVVVQVVDMCGTFGLVAFKVILTSFGALAILPKIQFPIKHYSFNKSQPKFIKLFLNYPSNGPRKLHFGIFEI